MNRFDTLEQTLVAIGDMVYSDTWRGITISQLLGQAIALDLDAHPEFLERLRAFISEERATAHAESVECRLYEKAMAGRCTNTELCTRHRGIDPT